MSERIKFIQKRDGRIETFQPDKITDAILKAIFAVGIKDGEIAKKLSDEVVKIVEDRFSGKNPHVEDIQDIVEQVLIKNGYGEVAKAYILYRKRRSEIREAKKFFGVVDDLKLGVNAIRVLKRRYLLKDERGDPIETPSQLFHRVAKAVAAADLIYDKNANVSAVEEEFYQLMANREFMPNSPTLMNAGTDIGQLSACFVVPVEDSIEGIFNAVKWMALIHKSGGGTGFSFSRLRPKNDLVKSTMGIASGPLSFMRVFDVTTDVIKQGGRRRGANMGILRVDHPDILEFVTAKSKEGVLTNFNISVAATDEFMKKVAEDEKYDIINPRTGKPIMQLRAKSVFDLIINNAWASGDPGLIFIDEINRHNPTPQIGQMEATNPCGEVPLLSFESCNLGSIDLSKMLKNGDVNWVKLRRTVRTAVHFLDNIIDMSKFPLPEIETQTKANRKIGLGVMGLAEALFKLNMQYDSDEALDMAEKFMKFINDEGHRMSVEIAERRGSFLNFKGSIWEKKGYNAMRNATVTTIAPTGTISIIAGTTSGIEPVFAITFVRSVMEGAQLLEVNPVFEKVAKERGFYSEDLMIKVSKKGSIQGINEIPEDVRRVFVTAFDVDPEWHVKMQAAFQKYTDNAVAKTVNLRHGATPEDVQKIYLLAYKLKCKGITIYRYGSKPEQVLYIGEVLGKEKAEEEYVGADSEYAGGCMTTYCPF